MLRNLRYGKKILRLSLVGALSLRRAENTMDKLLRATEEFSTGNGMESLQFSQAGFRFSFHFSIVRKTGYTGYMKN